MEEAPIVQEASYSDPSLMILIIALISLFLLTALCLMVIARKADLGDQGWWGFIPFLNFLLIIKIAEKPTWYIAPLSVSVTCMVVSLLMITLKAIEAEVILYLILSFGAILGLSFFTILCVQISKLRNMKNGWGVLMAVAPPVGFPIVAFAEPAAK